LAPPENLVQELGLIVFPVTVESVREELRRQINALHPDRTGGTFPSPQVEERYHQLRTALASLDGSQLPAPVSLEAVSQNLQEVSRRLDTALANHEIAFTATRLSSEQIRGDARAKYAPRKLGSAVFAAVCGAILTLATLLKDNPLFGPVARSAFILVALGILFAVSGGTFAFLWYKEHRAARRVDWLMSDGGMSMLLRNLILYRGVKDTSEEVLVSKSELIGVIQGLGRPWARRSFARWWKRIIQPQIPTVLAESIVNQHLEILLQRQVIQPKGLQGVEPVFVIRSGVVRDLRAGSYYGEW
jgi:hypothetical protein